MNYDDFSFAGYIAWQDYNGDVIEKKFNLGIAGTLASALESTKAIAEAIADGISGARIIYVKAIQTYTEVEPAPIDGESLTLVALLTCQIAGTSPQEYTVIEIPAPSPTIMNDNEVDLAHVNVIEYMNLLRENCYFGPGNGVLETDTGGDTLVTEGLRIYRGIPSF